MMRVLCLLVAVIATIAQHSAATPSVYFQLSTSQQLPSYPRANAVNINLPDVCNRTNICSACNTRPSLANYAALLGQSTSLIDFPVNKLFQCVAFFGSKCATGNSLMQVNIDSGAPVDPPNTVSVVTTIVPRLCTCSMCAPDTTGIRLTTSRFTNTYEAFDINFSAEAFLEAGGWAVGQTVPASTFLTAASVTAVGGVKSTAAWLSSTRLRITLGPGALGDLSSISFQAGVVAKLGYRDVYVPAATFAVGAAELPSPPLLLPAIVPASALNSVTKSIVARPCGAVTVDLSASIPTNGQPLTWTARLTPNALVPTPAVSASGVWSISGTQLKEGLTYELVLTGRSWAGLSSNVTYALSVSTTPNSKCLQCNVASATCGRCSTGFAGPDCDIAVLPPVTAGAARVLGQVELRGLPDSSFNSAVLATALANATGVPSVRAEDVAITESSVSPYVSTQSSSTRHHKIRMAGATSYRLMASFAIAISNKNLAASAAAGVKASLSQGTLAAALSSASSPAFTSSPAQLTATVPAGGEVQSAFNSADAIPCVLGELGAWSACSISKYEGIQTRTSIIVQPAQFGGACPIQSESRECSSPLGGGGVAGIVILMIGFWAIVGALVYFCLLPSPPPTAQKQASLGDVEMATKTTKETTKPAKTAAAAPVAQAATPAAAAVAPAPAPAAEPVAEPVAAAAPAAEAVPVPAATSDAAPAAAAAAPLEAVTATPDQQPPSPSAAAAAPEFSQNSAALEMPIIEVDQDQPSRAETETEAGAGSEVRFHV